MNDDDVSYQPCSKCSTMEEQFYCSDCGMTGPEIYLIRFETKTGEVHISRSLDDLSNWH